MRIGDALSPSAIIEGGFAVSAYYLMQMEFMLYSLVTI